MTDAKPFEELLDLLADQAQVEESELPPALPGPLGAPQRNQLKQLKSVVKDIAHQHSMAPEIILSGKDYEMLVREAAGEAVQAPLAWQGWRESLAITPLRTMLAEGKI